MLKRKKVRMGQYHRLTLEDRYQIYAGKNSGLSIREIARVLDRSASTVSRELKRNRDGNGCYVAIRAHRKAAKKRAMIGPPKKIHICKDKVDELLKLQWSPEQISGRLALDGIKISYESVYRYVYNEGKQLHVHLRRKRRCRRTRQSLGRLKNCGVRVNQTWIDERPKIVEQRERLGDFERDTVLGKNGRLLTIVDRVSRLTKIAKVERHNGYYTHLATLKLLRDEIVHTITNDSGPEFGLHDQTAKELNTKIYFNRPYSAWQRGTNENTNGLIRQYYPKGTDFSKITEEEVSKVESLLNNRPRKKLGFKTPLEVHTQKSQGVALRF